MNSLANYLLESNVILLVCGLVYFGWLRTEQHFQLRRVFVLCGVTCALLVPFVHLTPLELLRNNEVLTELSVFTLPELVIGNAKTETQTTDSFNWMNMVFVVYLAVLAVLLLRFCLQLWAIRKVLMDDTLHKSRIDGYTIVNSEGQYPTFSFFSMLVINSAGALSIEEKDQIVAHEIVHIRQFHSFDIVVLELLCALFWYNPVCWMLRTAQAENHEYIADAETSSRYDKHNYQSLLVKMTVEQMQMVGNYFSKVETLKRINMMNEKRKKSNGLKIGVALFSMVLVMTVLACSDGWIETANSATTTAAELPASIAAKLNELKVLHPDTKFTYVEVDAPGGNFDYKSEDGSIDMETIVHVEGFAERDKAGIILSPTAEFYAMAEYTKSARGVYKMVDEIPQPSDGLENFYGYIMREMQYPLGARKQGIEGRVFVQFVVNLDGKLTDVEVLKGIGNGCDEEAIRVLREAAPWVPGKNKGSAVKTRMILPITFSLGTDADKKLSTNGFEKLIWKSPKELEEEAC